MTKVSDLNYRLARMKNYHYLQILSMIPMSKRLKIALIQIHIFQKRYQFLDSLLKQNTNPPFDAAHPFKKNTINYVE
ncbi:hypothetical protein DWW88_18835 [Bacteroides cellulosilyticus]|nr:hypothetical protein DWZ09_10710 [Bacteroides cellulosilyticus]RGU23916.1 hypothetical protein DWW88_18835 [Bacteroides cellulosilyticus]